VRNPLFIGQELIDVPAVSLEQVLAILDSNHQGIELIRTDRQAIEFHE
jgi:hypothetical protein